jgi:Nitroreductase family
MQTHEAWLYGADRRLDLLAVPAFHAAPEAVAAWHAPRHQRQAQLLELPTHWPRPALALADHLAGRPLAEPLPPLRSLLLVLRHLASPARREPLNTYALHRCVASPRGAFPLRLQLVLRGASGPARRYAYEPEHHAFEDLGEDEAAQALVGEHGVALLGIAPFWALADKYGEFAPYAVTLEAGMLQAQLLHLVAAVGWRGAALAEAELACAAAEPGAFEAVALGWRGGVPGLAETLAAMPRRRVRLAATRAAADLDVRFPRLRALAAAFSPRADAGPAPTGSVGPGADPVHGPCGADAQADLFALMRRRSAGNDATGMAPRLDPLPAGACERLLATTRALAARRGSLPGEPQLAPVCAWLDSEPERLIDLQGQALPHPPGSLADVMQGALPNPGLRWNLRPFKCALILTAPAEAAQAAQGGGALRRLHIAAGALAQDFSLAATAEGLAARPMRMLGEQALQRGLALPGLPLYVVLCARNRSTNLSWELL